MAKRTLIYWRPVETWPAQTGGGTPSLEAGEGDEVFSLVRGARAASPGSAGVPNGVRLIVDEDSDAPLGRLLNRAVSESRGQNLVFLDFPGGLKAIDLLAADKFLADNPASIGIGLPSATLFPSLLADHLSRVGAPSQLAFLFAGAGRCCVRRNCFAARAPFDPRLEAPEVFVDFAFRHANQARTGSMLRTSRVENAVDLLPGWAAWESGARLALTAEELAARISAWDSLGPTLSRSLLAGLHANWARALRGGSDGLLVRAETILRCARETIPTRAAFSFLQEQIA